MIWFSSLSFEFGRIFFYLLSSSFTYSSFLFFQRNFNSVGGFISFESGIFFSSLFLPLVYGFFTPRFYSSERRWPGFYFKKITKFKSKSIIQIWLLPESGIYVDFSFVFTHILKFLQTLQKTTRMIRTYD